MLTAGDLTNMRESYDARLLDSCYIQALTTTKDTSGQVISTWSDTGSEIVCGLEMKAGKETQTAQKTTILYDAVLRVAITVEPLAGQRIRITKRYGEAITPIVFEVVSPPQRGPAGTRILLSKVVT